MRVLLVALVAAGAMAGPAYAQEPVELPPEPPVASTSIVKSKPVKGDTIKKVKSKPVKGGSTIKKRRKQEIKDHRKR